MNKIDSTHALLSHGADWWNLQQNLDKDLSLFESRQQVPSVFI